MPRDVLLTVRMDVKLRRAFLAEKVRLGREDIAAGRTVSHEQVVAEGEARRAALLKRLGKR